MPIPLKWQVNSLILQVVYLEEKNLTSGYTSALWKTPDEDIEFWYNNLKSAQLELSKVDSTTSTLEKNKHINEATRNINRQWGRW